MHATSGKAGYSRKDLWRFVGLAYCQTRFSLGDLKLVSRILGPNSGGNGECARLEAGEDAKFLVVLGDGMGSNDPNRS